MATIAEMFVDIGADASQFDRETKEMQTQMKGMQSEMKTMAQAMGTSSTQMTKDWQSMSNEMKMAMKASQESLKPFKQAQQEVQFGFFKMAQGMKDYQGTNAQFMNDVLAMGKAHKTATANMMIRAE
jgi:seryl-tRNA synthetase